MVKIKTKIEAKQVETIVSEKYLCDQCGNEMDQDSDNNNKDRTKILFRQGHYYPEYGEWTEEIAYFCEDCSNEIREYLDKKGVTFTIDSYDW